MYRENICARTFSPTDALIEKTNLDSFRSSPGDSNRHSLNVTGDFVEMDHSLMTSLYISCIIFAIFFGCDQVSGEWNKTVMLTILLVSSRYSACVKLYEIHSYKRLVIETKGSWFDSRDCWFSDESYRIPSVCL